MTSRIKRGFLHVIIVLLIVTLASPALFSAGYAETSADLQTTAEDPQATDNANSWRYENGQLIEGLGMSSKMRAAASHPQATLTGIDVSHHQGKINWEKVKAAGIDFAIIRCGYGLDRPEWDDKTFEYNADECERLGIPYGVYIYSYANDTGDAASEAEHVLRLIEDRNLSYPVYYDLEEDSSLTGGSNAANAANMASYAKVFCGKISGAGYPVGVYANKYWWNTYLTDPCFDDWYRWVAQYNTSCDYKGEYALWQYTSDGSVDGITGRVDMNFQIGYPRDHGYMWGDADYSKAVDSIDAMLTLRLSVGLIIEDTVNTAVMDVNGDESIDSIDAMLILRHSVNLIEKFPVEE